jgi:hypothetical protein
MARIRSNADGRNGIGLNGGLISSRKVDEIATAAAASGGGSGAVAESADGDRSRAVTIWYDRLQQEEALYRSEHPPVQLSVAGAPLSLQPELGLRFIFDGGPRWTVEWRGDIALAVGGEIVLLAHPDGTFWRVVVGEDATPEPVPAGFPSSEHAAVADWQRPLPFIGGSGGRRFIGLCDHGLWRLLADNRERESDQDHARDVIARAHARATQAAQDLEEALATLCAVEDARPAERLTAFLRACEVAGRPAGAEPLKRASERGPAPLVSLRAAAELVRLRLARRKPDRRRRGNPGDPARAAIIAATKAIGLRDSEVAVQLRRLELERWEEGETLSQAQRRGRRLTRRGYARERVRDNQRSRRRPGAR